MGIGGSNTSQFDGLKPSASIVAAADPKPQDNTVNPFYAACKATGGPKPTNLTNNYSMGKYWHSGQPACSRYNHLMPPNSWSCGYKGASGEKAPLRRRADIPAWSTCFCAMALYGRSRTRSTCGPGGPSASPRQGRVIPPANRCLTDPTPERSRRSHQPPFRKPRVSAQGKPFHGSTRVLPRSLRHGGVSGGRSGRGRDRRSPAPFAFLCIREISTSTARASMTCSGSARTTPTTFIRSRLAVRLPGNRCRACSRHSGKKIADSEIPVRFAGSARRPDRGHVRSSTMAAGCSASRQLTGSARPTSVCPSCP